ncbi:uncharacterized protein [Elaeis guineensis]|uniref:Uncharacterized protein LOC105033826 n=1 Tax=Elaeis guineensis var. tenera TaxID=51953 RepID=A0A6I9QDV2_ELAGV|nr:uncharacterized protein LOC105033826 [Elaeis guineensis]
MKISLLPAVIREMLLHRGPLLRYAATWTAVLTATVAVTSFAPEIAFVWALSPESGFAQRCRAGAVRVPVEGPAGEVVCVPAQLFGRSKADLFVPPLFAALVVWGSALFVRSVGLWESEEAIG